MSYGASITDAYRQVGIYGRSDLQGREAGRPADHAVDQIRTGHQYENAKTLQLDVPQRCWHLPMR